MYCMVAEKIKLILFYLSIKKYNNNILNYLYWNMVNLNNLLFKISLIILLSVSALQNCPANLQLLVFYKCTYFITCVATVSLSMLRGTRSTPGSNRYAFYYVLNYPS